MPDRQQLYQALMKADAAGDTTSAKALADYIRSLPADEAPAQPAGSPSLARSTAAAQAVTSGFADELQAGLETANYAVGELFSPRGVDVHDLADYYRERRDAYRQEAGQLAESNPTETTQGTVIGTTAAVAPSLLGVNPVGLVRGAVTGGRALLTSPLASVATGARSLLSVEGAQAAGVGAAYGGLTAAGSSEADLTQGEVGQFAQDVAGGAKTGALVGAGARGLLAAGSSNVAARAEAAGADLAAAQAADRDQALLKTGLEGRQKKLGGPLKAKQRAQEILDEPLPGDPSKNLFQEAEKLSPEDRIVLAEGIRRDQGKVLGGVRDRLAQVPDAKVSAKALKADARTALKELPSDVQEAALEKIDAMINAQSENGYVPATGLRKLIKDADANARFGTQATDATLGNARKRVFRAAYGALTGREKELVQKFLPQDASVYPEALRKYDVYLDFEEGARIKFERANKGQPQTKQPKREEADSAGRKLLKIAAGEVGARVGSLIPVPGAAVSISKGAEAIVDRWGRWLDPLAAASAKVKKLDRLRPLFEDALSEGPQAVAALHARLMQRSPDYRKALEAGE